MTAVVFDYAKWSARYPALAAFTSDATAESYFDEATALCSNADNSLVPYNPPSVTTRATALNMLVAHIAALNDPARGGLTGRLSSAGEGGANITTELTASEGMAYYVQTPYGLAYWELTKPYRKGFYVPGAQPFYQPRRR